MTQSLFDVGVRRPSDHLHGHDKWDVALDSTRDTINMHVHKIGQNF